MKFFLNILLGLLGLLLFAKLVMSGGVVVFNMIFDLAGGDADVLSFAVCGFIVLFVGGCWIWSDKNRCRKIERWPTHFHRTKKWHDISYQLI